MDYQKFRDKMSKSQNISLTVGTSDGGQAQKYSVQYVRRLIKESEGMEI